MYSKKIFNFFLLFLTIAAIFLVRNQMMSQSEKIVLNAQTKQNSYWFELERKSNVENLYKGVPGDKTESIHIRSFKVKTGIPGERPTPLPQVVGKQYWLITKKESSAENPETAPYFLTLNIPAPSEEPYGPVPYNECNGQCSWVLPGAFGLHGTGGHPEKLSDTDAGSSGCIRHSDEDITYLYNLLDPVHEEIRYYIVDR